MNDLEISELAQDVERMSMSLESHDVVQALVEKHGGWVAVWDVFEESTDLRVRRLGFTLRAARAISDQAETIADRLRMDEQYFIELSARASVFAKRGRLDEASEYVGSVAYMLCVLMEQILRADPTDEAAARLLAQWSEIASVMKTR
jgi:hypothetical protein